MEVESAGEFARRAARWSTALNVITLSAASTDAASDKPFTRPMVRRVSTTRSTPRPDLLGRVDSARMRARKARNSTSETTGRLSGGGVIRCIDTECLISLGP